MPMTLLDIVTALDGQVSPVTIRYDATATGGRTFVDCPTRTDFLAACQALGLQERESPTSDPRARHFYAHDGTLAAHTVYVQAVSTVDHPDWQDKPVSA